MKKSTPNCFVYGESGQYPLYIHVYSRMISFWHKLIIGNENKMSISMLKTLNECFNLNIYKSEWLKKIKQILDSCGLSYIWENHKTVTTLLKNTISAIHKDIFRQEWTQLCNDSNKGCNYYLYKLCFGFKKYLDYIP